MNPASTLSLALLLSSAAASAQLALLPPAQPRNIIYDTPVEITDTVTYVSHYDVVDDYAVDPDLFPRYVPSLPAFYRPVVFDTFHFIDPVPMTGAQLPADSLYGWLDRLGFQEQLIANARQRFIIDNPAAVVYNEAHLPEPPKHFVATVDPTTAVITIEEIKAVPAVAPDIEPEFEKRHWIRKFNAALQFSQAYVSPNWYQGGNNNLNALASVYYNVRLNPKMHPNWLFETTFQYKLGINDTRDDELRNYSISEDLLQLNMMAGYKAAKGWYYSSNLTFKTQVLNSYKTNTYDLKAAFMSPAELNVGLGMTYNHTNAKKTFTIDASISPLSWNLKTCLNHKMDETALGLKPGHSTLNQIGSNAEVKISWNITSNISYRSRFFVFTDYEYVQGDWENTFNFAINKFLSTQLFFHARYDSSVPSNPDWHKLQLKEILSFGISYSFSSL